MAKKTFMVVGLGLFGEAIALELERLGMQVIGVDKCQERVDHVADYLTMAVCIDVCNDDQFRNLDLARVDGMVIAMAEDTDASVMATIIAKEEGVPYVYAKARDGLHMKILKRVGADEAEVPERASGIHLARKMANDNLRNFVELSTRFRLVETSPKEEWVGKSLKDLNLRKKYNINVIGYHRGDHWSIQIDPDKPLEKDMNLLVILDEEGGK